MPDVILNTVVPEIWITRVLTAFNIITDANIIIKVEKEDEFDGHWQFKIESKTADENNKQFGERVLRELGKAIVNMVDIAEDNVRYKAEINNITPPSSDVPDDILS